MVLSSPSANAASQLAFWDAEDEPDLQATGTKDEPFVGPRGPSIYVMAFEDMLREVLSGEAHLFSHEELECFKVYDTFSYNARYLLVRLCLRKTNKWHRLSAMKYTEELGDGIISAIQELCGSPPAALVMPMKPGPEEVRVKVEVIDLTLDEDAKPMVEPSLADVAQPKQVPDYTVFAEDERAAELAELMDCLSTEELKGLAKQMKVKAVAKRDQLMAALMNSSSGQATLSTFFARKGKATSNTKPLLQSQLLFRGSKQASTQRDRLREMIIKTLVKCIRVNEDVVKLFRRINLVYFRSTIYTLELLTPSLLARFRKRTYAPYEYKRTPRIFPSRDALLAYEEALALEAEVDFLLEGFGSGPAGTRDLSVASKTLAPPVKQEHANGKSRGPGKENDVESVYGDAHESVRVQNARAVKAIFERVYPQWQELIRVKGETEGREKGLERFDCGHILTRVVCKGSAALGILKEHPAELDVLESLLAQRRWRRGRRGRWYERRALILMTHTIKGLESDGLVEVLQRAKRAVSEALLDEDTHSVYRPKLIRRLTLLEKRLHIPEEERHVCIGKLEKAANVRINGTRIYHRGTSLMLDCGGRVINKAAPADHSAVVLKQTQMTQYAEVAPSQKRSAYTEVVEKWTGKSVWHGRDDGGNPAEVSVEQLALQHYEDQGFKGFHCEGRILTTLFGLLFWDVIFASIAGAFETPFQTAPLDIAEDTFYFSRQELADQRLQDLKDGKSCEILESVFERHAAAKTFCVGVRWDVFSKEDLLHIAEFLGGEGLAVICRLFCEDYAGRGAGVPDLILWHTEQRVCKFVEVKGPGDTLQENQKVWIDVLLQAGVPVEVCHVSEHGKTDHAKSKKGKASKKAGNAKRKREETESESDVAPIESEDEPEQNYSQMDLYAGPSSSPATPKKKHLEVVITSSPADFASPAKKRLKRERSPEV